MKIIIVGCGRMGAGLAIKLATAGHFVTVIDPNPASFELLGTSVKCMTFTGMGYDRDLLLQAKIERADALAAVTASDEANIVIARLAKNIFNVPKVIARLCDVRKSEIYQRLGLQTIDPITWGLNRVSDILCCTPLETVHSIGSGDVEIVEIEVPEHLIGSKAGEFAIPGEFQVIAISNSNNTTVPSPDTQFSEKDVIHITVAKPYRNHLKELLGLT